MPQISAGLHFQQQSWQNSFVFNDPLWVRSDKLFSNGYRYFNWAIDVPMLLTQLLIVLGFTGRKLFSRWWKLALAGLAMVFTGYVGQFYEVTNIPALLIWGTISTVFYAYLLYLVWISINEGVRTFTDDSSRRMMEIVRWVLVISWMLYAGAYLAPLLGINAPVVVVQQITFTVADVTSKVIYGVLLSLIAESRSVAERNEQAIVAQGKGDNVPVVAQT